MSPSPKLKVAPPLDTEAQAAAAAQYAEESITTTKQHRLGSIKRTILATSRLALTLLVLITVAIFSFRHHPLKRSFVMSSSSSAATHPLDGWHSRLQPFEGTFTPTLDSLALVHIRSVRLDPEGISVALFAPNIVVDARGVVSTLREEDWQGLKSLAEHAVSDAVPQTGSTFMNQWRIKHGRTGYPINWLRVGQALKSVAVYGFDGRNWSLEEPVGDITELPQVLRDTFQVLEEGREGYERGQEDDEVLSKVKAVLPEPV